MGTYLKHSENCDFNIPKHFGDMVSEDIYNILRGRNIYLSNFSKYVDQNKELGTVSDLSYYQKIGFIKKMFVREKQIITNFDSQDLLGEHVYLVVSILKCVGFKNVKAIPVKDIGRNSEKYIFEVEQVVINGVSFFEEGDMFLESAEVIITYHTKQEIAIPYTMNYFKKKNYTVV